MKNRAFVSVWIKRFLLEYLISTKNLSKNTQLSYRDSFRLLLPFAAKKNKKPIDQLLIEEIAPSIVKSFLTDLEMERRCSISTRNQRLSSIHAFANFVGLYNPEHLEWCRQIQIIPFKRSQQGLITYLEKAEMDALLKAPDKRTEQGRRDHLILLFLYNTGVRADEAAQLKINDLNIATGTKKELNTVLIRGKGNKLRRCPLWEQTSIELRGIIGLRTPAESLFLNRLKQPLTRFGIHAVVKRNVVQAAKQCPSILKKKVSPHTIRHTTATHLLQSGVDINTIRAWLGHVSINMTNIYAEVDLSMKAKALACCEIEDKRTSSHWNDTKGLMTFLESL